MLQLLPAALLAVAHAVALAARSPPPLEVAKAGLAPRMDPEPQVGWLVSWWGVGGWGLGGWLVGWSAGGWVVGCLVSSPLWILTCRFVNWFVFGWLVSWVVIDWLVVVGCSWVGSKLGGSWLVGWVGG